MRRLLIRGLWRLVGRRIGWVALASVGRILLRRSTSRRVDEAATDLEQRLPEPVRSALTRLPGDPVRVGGGAVVAGRSARQVAVGAGRASRAADVGRRRLGRDIGRVTTALGDRPRPARSGRDLAARLGAEIQAETDRTERNLRSRLLLDSRGRAAADDALLDRRLDPTAPQPPEPPPPVPPGRWLAPRRRAGAEVPRVQRTYRPPRRPWDR